MEICLKRVRGPANRSAVNELILAYTGTEYSEKSAILTDKDLTKLQKMLNIYREQYIEE